MRKRFTKIICAATAAISVFGLVFASACGNLKRQAVSEKDTTASTVQSNGGFAVQTGDYVYFINGVQSNTADNTFGDVLKGSVQRIKKSDIAAGNYSSSLTIVPSVIYSGQYNAGIYIYGDYIYYTTPSTQKDGSGSILNGTLDFRRTTLDGAETDRDALWQCTDNAVDYRFVEVDDTVYIMYAIAENLYGTSVTNIHSVNVETGEDKILAYNVGSYLFDTADPANPVAYYTMSVPRILGESENYSYNQIYRVRADAAQSPREYDFSEVEDYDASTDPVYINYGDFAFDGIGSLDNQTEARITQFNYAYWSEKQYSLHNGGYNYTLNGYENGALYYTRKESTVNSSGIKYLLKDGEIDSDGNGRVDDGWDAVDKNAEAEPFIILTDNTEYKFIDLGGKTYAINANGDGIEKGELSDGVVKDSYPMVKGDDGSDATILFFREEETESGKNTYMYYSVDGANGYSFYRLAIDGGINDYTSYPQEAEADRSLTYTGVKILDLDACADWYMPEFVGNTLLFASEIGEMSSYNYIMACDLSKDGKMMTNRQIKDLGDKYDGVAEKIGKYNDETNTDGTEAYKNLSNALTYLWNTGDGEYLDELIQAYVDIEGRDKEYLYSERSAEIYHEFDKAEGDWADYKEGAKTLNGGAVYSNSRSYYYSVIGRMTDEDSEGLRNAYRADNMQSYPVDDSTWWEGLSTGAKVGFIIGMCAAGLVVIGGITVGVIFLIKHLKKKKSEGVSDAKIKVDITDDKNVNVYDDGEQQ